MKQPIQQPSRWLRPFLIALCLALGIMSAVVASAGATRLPALVPPKDVGVALAEIATVRVEADYTINFTINANSQALPLPGVCSGLGVLAASTSPLGAGQTYLLTTSQVLAQNFCQTPTLTGATLKGITFDGARVYLSTAYAGANAGTNIVTFTFPKENKNLLPPTNGTPTTTVLVPLTAPAGAALHDYPTISLTAPPNSGIGQKVAIDLLNKTAQALNSNQLNAFALPGTPTSTAQAKDFLVPTTADSTSPTLSPGTPLIDSQTGVLTGLAASGGGTPIAVDPAKVSTLNPKCPGDAQCLSQRWQQAMTAFYGSPTHTGAAPLLQGIHTSYPDFGGIQEFLDVVASPTPTLAPSPSATPSNQTPNDKGIFGLGKTEIFIALGVLGVLLLAVISMTFLIYVQKTRKRQKGEPPDEREAIERAQPFSPRTSNGQIAQANFSGMPSSGGAPPVAPGAATLPYSPSMQSLAQSGRAVTCPTCGAQNNAGSSVCFNCGHDLPQVPGAVSGSRSYPPATSGGPARLNLPSLSQPPTALPPIPAASDPGSQAAVYAGNVRVPYQEGNQDTEPTIQAVPNEERTVVLPGRKRPAFGVMVSSRSDRGRKRAGKENEDNFLAITGSRMHNGQAEPFGLFVVADGMGGHANGQDASRMAIESIYLDLAPRLTTQELPDEELTALLQQAVQSANQKLYRQNQQDHADMGCTMTAALVAGDEAHICNVGDSRTYLLHPGGELQRVTVDHSIVQSLVDAGVIQKDDVYTHPKRNQIYRSLGEKEVIEIDMYRQRVTPGDKLLLCCDGLWEMIRDNEIEMILGHTDDLPQASSKLIEMANEHGGVDNITAVVVKVTEEGKPAKRPGIESLASGPATLPKRAG
ncbi:MAG TPA: protein phosphatase 2C domain-containing protein [Ktedonobacterales bacterium]